MSFNIFNRWSKEERRQRKIIKLIREMCKVFNPDLILKLETDRDHKGEIYFAIKEVFEDYILRRMPEVYEKSRQIMTSVGVAQSIEGLKDISKDDPQSTFLFLVEIYARLLTEEEFKKLFKDLLGLPSEVMDMIIFKNPNLNLQFRRN